MATLLADAFTRTSTTSIGAPTTGGPYTVRSGTWGTDGTQLYTPVAAVESMVTAPGAVDVDFSLRYSVLGTAANIVGLGQMIRWVDANNFWTVSKTNSSAVILQRRVAGTYVSFNAARAIVAGDVVRLVGYKDTIYLLINNKIADVAQDYWYGNGASLIGYRMQASLLPRGDDALAVDATAPPNAPTGSAGLTSVLEDDAYAEAIFASPQPAFLYKGRDTHLEDEGSGA